MLESLHDPRIDVVVPVYNEERALAVSIPTLVKFLACELPYRWSVVIADNASTDGTPAASLALVARCDHVRYLRLEQKGRGRALKAAWSASPGDVLVYMDVDLSTGLTALLPLTASLISGHAGVAIGSRLLPQSNVVRGRKRELISRSYNRIIRAGFRPGFHDAQCGFKAIRADVARTLLPLVEDDAWFFDTELLLVAEHNGVRVAEVPVDWVDDPDSRVHIRSTAIEDLKGLWRMRRTFWSGEGRIGSGLPATSQAAEGRPARV